MKGVWTRGAVRKVVRAAAAFYEDPDNVKAFREWQKRKAQQKGSIEHEDHKKDGTADRLG